jgi:hypothetical protein
MTDNQARAAHAWSSSRTPDEDRLAATCADGRRILHDQQRTLVQASLVARPQGESTTHHRGA